MKRTNQALTLMTFVIPLMLNPSHAATLKVPDPSLSPLGCKDVGYQFELNTLKLTPGSEEGRQSLYFMYNRLNQPVRLYQMINEESTHSSYLNHTILPQLWAVLATGEPSLRYICTVDDGHSAYGKVVPCQEYIKVCEYVRVKFGLNTRGNFWIVNSTTRGGAVSGVTQYGIIPR